MQQFVRTRWVWLFAMLLFTGVLIFASWDRGVAIDYDGTGCLCAVIRLWTEHTVTDSHISGRWDADNFSYIAIGDRNAARALAAMQ